MTNIYSLLIVVAIAAYLIVRQFQERAVTPMSLLLFPLLITYYTYTDIVHELTKPLLSGTIVVVIMILGLLAGGLLGVYRGKQTLMRFDTASNRVMARACAINIVLYLVTFAIRIGVATMLYVHLNDTSIVAALSIALLTTFFLGNIVMEKVVLYQRSRSAPLYASSPQVAR